MFQILIGKGKIAILIYEDSKFMNIKTQERFVSLKQQIITSRPTSGEICCMLSEYDNISRQAALSEFFRQNHFEQFSSMREINLETSLVIATQILYREQVMNQIIMDYNKAKSLATTLFSFVSQDTNYYTNLGATQDGEINELTISHLERLQVKGGTFEIGVFFVDDDYVGGLLINDED